MLVYTQTDKTPQGDTYHKGFDYNWFAKFQHPRSWAIKD